MSLAVICFAHWIENWKSKVYRNATWLWITYLDFVWGWMFVICCSSLRKLNVKHHVASSTRRLSSHILLMFVSSLCFYSSVYPCIISFAQVKHFTPIYFEIFICKYLTLSCKLCDPIVYLHYDTYFVLAIISFSVNDFVSQMYYMY